MDTINVLDVVALKEALPSEGLRRGEVGTVVEQWSDNIFEVEFSDESGVAYAFAALRAPQLMKLHFNKVEVAETGQLNDEARKLLDEGFALLNNGNEVEAEKPFRLAIALDSKARGAILNSILKSFDAGVNWEAKIQFLRFLYHISPDYEAGKNNLAIAYLNCGVEKANEGDIEAAHLFFYYAIGVQATPEVESKIRENFAGVLTTIGIKEHKSGNYHNSLGFMRMACVVFPDEKTRRNLGLADAHLAWSYLDKHDYESAIAFFEAAEETGLILPELLNDYAIALVFENRLGEAVIAFDRALELAPDNLLIKENFSKLSKSESIDTLVIEEIKAEYIYIPTAIQQYQAAA